MTLVSALTVGCASPSKPAATRVGGIELPAELPRGQRAAFSDGSISTQEYQAAVHAFADCSGNSVLLNPPDPATGYTSYTTKGDIGEPGHETNTPPGRCYREYLSWIEMVWDLTDPTMLASGKEQAVQLFEESGRKCLEDNGIKVPAGRPNFDDPQFQQWQVQVSELQAKGVCPPNGPTELTIKATS